MTLKNLVWEDTVNYRKPSLFLGTARCSFKCGPDVCQNYALRTATDIVADDAELIRRYKDNPITEAIVFGGLEPLDQLTELLAFCDELNRQDVRDDLVIYTGYEQTVVTQQVGVLLSRNTSRNVIIKYGGYIPGRASRFEPLLGVTLASDNQYAKEYPAIPIIDIYDAIPTRRTNDLH